jgi:glycosyl transferase family 87
MAADHRHDYVLGRAGAHRAHCAQAAVGEARVTLLRWIVLALAVIAAYAVASALLVPHLVEFNDVRHHVDFTVGIALPLHVVWQALGGWRLTLCLWALAAGLGIAGSQCARAIAVERPQWQLLLCVQALLLAALLTVAVTFSGDVYAYVIYGRLYGLHGLNPYLLGSAIGDYADAALRQCLAFYGNPPPADNYGPLWTLLAGGLSRLEAGLSLAAQVWTHRIIAALFAVAATGGLLYAMRALPAAQRVKRAGMFALHPLVLYEAAVGGHNDLLMIAPAVWAFAVAEDLPLVAGLLLGASIAVKYVSVILVPFLALKAARRGAASGLLCAFIAVALPALFFRPFWEGVQTLYSLVGHGGIFAMSPQWLINIPFFATGVADRQPLWPRAVQGLALLTFAAVALFSLARAVRNREAANIWRTVTTFVLSLPIIHPWYVLWTTPAAADRGRWSSYAWWLGMFAFVRYSLDGIAPAEAGAAYTPMLAFLTVVMLGLPAVLCLRDKSAADEARGEV